MTPPFASSTSRWRTAPSPSKAPRRASSGATAAGPGTKTSPRRASITASASSSPAERVQRRDPCAVDAEREPQPAGDREPDPGAREAARARTDDECVHVGRPRRRLAEERVDVLEQRGGTGGPLPEHLAVVDQRAGRDVSRGVERQDQHRRLLVAARPRPRRR